MISVDKSFKLINITKEEKKVLKMTKFVTTSDIKKTPKEKFVSLPPANRRTPARQKPLKQKRKKTI